MVDVLQIELLRILLLIHVQFKIYSLGTSKVCCHSFLEIGRPHEWIVYWN